MRKYFDENGVLRPEYMEKIQILLDAEENKYNIERDLLTAGLPAKQRAYEAAKKAYENAKKAMDDAYGAWMAGDSGFGLVEAKNKRKRQIMESCLKTFSDLQDQLDEKDGTAAKRQQIVNNLLRMNLQSESPFLEKPKKIRAKSYQESVREDEEGN